MSSDLDNQIKMSNGDFSPWHDHSTLGMSSITGGMRRRIGIAVDDSLREAPRSGESSVFVRAAQRFDLYAKVDDDLQVKTEAGAAVTIGFWVLIVLLVWGEVAVYLREVPATERLVVDSTMGQKLRINTDMTFHSIPCLDVHVDAMDVAGQNQLDIDHDMSKQRLSSTGETIGDPFSEVPGEMDKDLELPNDYCGSCYGAAVEGKCCNTCKEVTDAYSVRGWTLHDIRRSAEQCIRDLHIDTPIEKGEGCRLYGVMEVNKVSGNFHVAAGEGVMRDGRHVHQYSVDEASAFNSSHTVHKLSFGEPYPGMRPNPLDGTERIIDEDVGTGLFQYFIKLVPTIHVIDADGSSKRSGEQDGERAAFPPGDSGNNSPLATTSQFAYTFKFRSLKGFTEYHHHRDADAPDHHAAVGEEHGVEGEAAQGQPSQLLPGVFFVYDLSPFMVEVIPGRRSPFSHLLIRLCAVAGGAFAVSGLVNAVVFHVPNRFKQKSLLGM